MKAASTLACALAGGVTILSLPAFAQVGWRAPATHGAYGGGLLELMMTGRTPGPTSQPAQPTRRLAALPVSPEAAIPYRQMDGAYRRQVVSYDGPEAAGTIVVHTPSRFLYHVQGGRRAVRYGIGVGRPGFEWAGVKTVTSKKEWPDWTPPPQMLKRRPELPRFMAGGPDNPMGARALYLGSSLFRIHGTNEPSTIGQNVSSGCIRMMNEDVIELYRNVAVGTKVKVI